MTSNDNHSTLRQQIKDFYVMSDHPALAEFKALFAGDMKVQADRKADISARLQQIFG